MPIGVAAWSEERMCLTDQLTPCSNVVLEKLIVAQLVKNSPPLMETECSLPHSQNPLNRPMSHVSLDIFIT
jgi:hypothetical protein